MAQGENKMNSIALEQVLPPESLPTFTVRKIANISGVFSNPYLSIGEEKLREYAVAVEDSRTKFEYVGEPILIHAERYGGTGIGTHGGGVRCGYLNGWQVKGSGQNLLSGHDVEFWHSHGALAQVEAFYEALWGEALSVILPFGAIRSPGIILTDGISWQKHKNGAPVEVPRGLLVREAGVRPAHFERRVGDGRHIDVLKHLLGFLSGVALLGFDDGFPNGRFPP